MSNIMRNNELQSKYFSRLPTCRICATFPGMQTTLCLPDDIAETIKQIVRPYRGSVPGYAAQLATDFAKLPPADRQELHSLIDMKLRRREARAASEEPSAPHMGGVPAIPNR